MIKEFARKVLPEKYLQKYKARRQAERKRIFDNLEPISYELFNDLLLNKFNIRKGDTVFIHSSLDNLKIGFDIKDILPILIDTVGAEGTLLFPTYPHLPSYEYLKSGEVFNVKRTPSFTGLLSEIARRHKESIRSLHPTKSVVAIGKYAKELTETHHQSPYPYDNTSPYFKVLEHNSKSFGIGVTSNYFSSTHIVDDYMKDKFPVKVYHDELFAAKCIDYEGNEVTVNTYAHNIRKMKFNIPLYFKNHVSKEVASDFQVNGMNFFLVNSNPLFNIMLKLAEKNITIYQRIYYKWNKLI
jgi:aminoglycoside 3-N-acetyltransferase